MAFLALDPSRNWTLPPCLNADYDQVILQALAIFFKIIRWKLKNDICFKLLGNLPDFEQHWYVVL
jgi:hypothetical protein